MALKEIGGEIPAMRDMIRFERNEETPEMVKKLEEANEKLIKEGKVARSILNSASDKK